MTYTLKPVAVRLDSVRSVLGSRNEALLATVVREFADEAQEIDEMAEEAADDRGVAPVTLGDALRALITGGERQAELGFVYGYAFCFLCEQLGETLDNEHWSGMAARFYDRLDAAFAAVTNGSEAVSRAQLSFRGAPVPLPTIEDFPEIGYLLHAELAPALQALDPQRLATLTDNDARASLEQLRRWLLACDARGNDLFCFSS